MPGNKPFIAAAAALFLLALLCLGALTLAGGFVWELGLLSSLALLGFGLLSIYCGFPHPYLGHVSFDRVAQFSAVLIVGPLPAAIINMTASFLYPWGRLRQGERWPAVLAAAMANSGMMALTILAGGYCYLAAGGVVPITGLSLELAPALLLMALVANLVNDLLMVLLVKARGGNPRSFFRRDPMLIEGFAVFLAILVALLWQTSPPAVFAMFMLALFTALFQIRQLGVLRLRLEERVNQRTRALQEQSQKLETMARTDELTGLYNRRHAYERLCALTEDAAAGPALTVAILDLDHFKRINDQHTHQVGDEVLRRVAQALTASVGDNDFVARLGGEEFVLCLGCDQSMARQRCEAIRQCVAEVDLSDLIDWSLTASIGLTESTGEAVEELLKRADVALYRAKAAGRDRVVVAEGPSGT